MTNSACESVRVRVRACVCLSVCTCMFKSQLTLYCCLFYHINSTVYSPFIGLAMFTLIIENLFVMLPMMRYP